MARPRPLPRLLCVCILAGVAACRDAAPTIVPGPDAAFVTATNAAIGQMGRYDFAAAVDAFATLAAAHPESGATSFNLAVARINRQQPDDAADAERRLRLLLDDAALGRRARYALGLLLLYQGRDADAFPLLAAVASSAPDDAFPAYFAGQARLPQAPAEALTWFERSLAIDPLMRSAHYGAFQALQRLGRADDAAGRLTTFQSLERDPRARLAEFKYTRMGPMADAVFVDAPAPPAPRPPGSRFSAPALVSALPDGDRRAASITVADIDGDGALDLFVAGAVQTGPPNAVLLGRGDTWAVSAGHPLAGVPGVRAALWGDLDDDGRVDVVLVRGGGRTALWRQSASNAWRDVTAEWRAATPAVDAVDGALFDADHDGDLDLLLVSARGPTALLNNNGNGTFRNIAAQAGIAGDGRPATGVVVADLDGDRDHDLIVLKAAPPHDVWMNDRVWQYHRASDYEAFAAAAMDAVLAADLDADGRPELYALSGRGLERWRPTPGGQVRVESLTTASALPPAMSPRLALADTDGNGVHDLVVSTASGWTVIDVPPDAPAGRAEDGGTDPIATWTVASRDPRRGPSIVGVDARGVVAWTPGAGRQPFLAIGVTGRSQASDQRRSNTSGIGTRVHVRTGSRWTAFDTVRLQSGGGQSLQPTAIGLGGAPRADLVSLVWSDGILQSEIGLDGGRLHTIQETQRQLSSCPVLFAFDGTATRFVTDVLGVGGIGFFERPGVYSAPFPQESVLLPDGALAPTADGRLRLVIGEPMEEVAYLDHLGLTAYDLPPGWQLALDERKAIASAPPTGAAIFFRDERTPVVARNDRGDDVLTAIAAVDRRAAPPGAVDPRFVGRTSRHTLEVEFAGDLDQGSGRPVLVLDGWVEYPYAQTVFAAWQANAPYTAPTLEARDGRGRWRVIAAEFGYPAGMPRRMTLPLPTLPAGTRALRLSTTQEIYWDRVAVAFADGAPDVASRPLALAAATLAEAGFATRTTGPQRTPHYDYGRRRPLWDTRHPRGWYTRFGDVEPLIRTADDALVILGPGEEVVVEFTAPAAAPPPGWTRRYVLNARGWCKDMDLYTRDGDTVTPLPGRDTAARRRLHREFTTRFEAGQ